MAMRRPKIASLLGSAKLAVGLMIYLGIVSFIGTFVPQGAVGNAKVAAWVAANPQWEALARALGLHSLFTAWYFVAPAALLAASTVVCSWRRTKVAHTRSLMLREAKAADGALPGRADYSIPLGTAGGANSSAALAGAEAALAELGIRGSRCGNVFVAASAPWSVWGSAAFHWALVLIFLTLAMSALFRADGLMGVTEGEAVKDEAAAYRVLTTGPLHDWSAVNRKIFLNQLRRDYVVDGMDRGASPDVSVLDSNGVVVARQVIYPNNLLHTGTLTIHNSAWGLAPRFELLDKSGSSIATSSVLLDLPSKPTGSTGSDEFELTGRDGKAAVVVRVTVPLDRQGGKPVDRMPRRPKAKVELLTPDGKPTGGATLGAGEKLALPNGASLRLERVAYYARLSVMDDPTIPLLYASLAAALAGMTFALLVRQRLVVVALSDEDGEPHLDVLVRLWANAGPSAGEVKSALLAGTARGGEDRGVGDDQRALGQRGRGPNEDASSADS